MVMTNLTKVLIGTAIVGTVCAVAGVVAAVSEKEDKADTKVASDENSKIVEIKTVDEVKDESVLKKIKRFVVRKVVKFLTFVALHSEQIEAASTVIGLTTGIIGIAKAVKEFRRGEALQDQINEMDERLKAVNQNQAFMWKKYMETKDIDFENFRTVNNNVISVLNKLGEDIPLQSTKEAV